MTTMYRRFLDHIEQPAQPYSGRGETALAVAVLPLTFVYKMLDCLYGKQPIPVEPWPYILLLSAFTAVAFSSILFLATPTGERSIRRALAGNGPKWLAATPPVFVGLFLTILWGFGFPELHTLVLSNIAEPWSRLPLPLFLVMAGIFLYGGLRWGLALAARSDRNSLTPAGFGWWQLLSVLVTVAPFLVFQEQLPLLWCFTTPAAVIVMVYGTGLGREYFGYSFVPRSAKEALLVIVLLACGLLLFLFTTLWSGSITYTGGLWHTSRQQIYDSVFVYLLIVGISEEVLFRCGVLTLVAALFAKKSAPGWCSQNPRLSAVLVTSALFALSHLFRGATLFFLSFLASLLYGLAFVAGRSLFGPVILHGLLNVLIFMNFHLADFH